MQPTVIVHVPAAGMICLNGRFAGESTPQRPLFAPVCPSGALYIEYRPLEGDCDAMARRLVLSGGEPLAEPLAQAEGLWAHALSVGMRRKLLENASERFDDPVAACADAMACAWPEELEAPATLKLPGFVGEGADA